MQKSIVLPTTAETELIQFVMDVTTDAARKDLIQVLQAVQERYGYLPKEAFYYVSEKTGLIK